MNILIAVLIIIGYTCIITAWIIDSTIKSKKIHTLQNENTAQKQMLQRQYTELTQIQKEVTEYKQYIKES